jgi:hypothetical protein
MAMKQGADIQERAFVFAREVVELYAILTTIVRNTRAKA